MKKILHPLVLLAALSIVLTCEQIEISPITKITTISASPGLNTITATGKIIELSKSSHGDFGFSYGTTINPTVADGNMTLGSANVGEFTGTIEGLTMGQQYYIRAYCKEGGSFVYGESISTTTYNTTVTTANVTNIFGNSATCGGTVGLTGSLTITQRGVCWSSAQNPTTALTTKTLDGSGTGSFISQVTGLTISTHYYIRAYAVTSTTTIYGDQKEFTTNSTPAPELTTGAITLITGFSATISAEITDDKGSAVTARGICWGTAQNPTVTDNKITVGSGIGPFTGNIVGLSPNTTYYARAYATNGGGTAYGNQVTFTTLNPSTLIYSMIGDAFFKADGVTHNDWTYDLDFTYINTTNSISTYKINTLELFTGKEFKIRQGHDWLIGDYGFTDLSFTGDPGNFVEGLVGTNNVKVLEGKTYEINFIVDWINNTLTLSAIGLTPTITTKEVISITGNSATCGGNITAQGGSAVTARGVCWSSSTNPTTTNDKTSDGAGTGEFTSSIIGLTAGTTYYVRAYATNGSGTAYGNEVTFNTSPNLPTVTTDIVSAVTATTATCGGNVTDIGGAAVTTRGVCWSKSASPTITNVTTVDGSGMGIFTSSLLSLSPNTTYYIRAYATNSAGTGYGDELTFTTADPATITYSIIGSETAWATDIDLKYVSTTDNTSTYNILSKNFKGSEEFKIRKDHDWVINFGYPELTITGETGNFVDVGGNIGVLSDRTYEVIFDMEWSSNLATLTMTNLTPSILANTLSSITTTTANFSSEVLSQGTSAVTARGVCWSTSINPTTANNVITNGSGIGVFTCNLTGLTANTTYYIRGYATNSAGTSFGKEVSFTTAPVTSVVPTLSTTAVTSITTTTATSGGNITSDGGATVTVSGVCWSTALNPFATGSHTTDGTATGVFTSTITGLTAGTIYYVRAYATNSVGTGYGSQVSFTTLLTPTITNFPSITKNYGNPAFTLTAPTSNSTGAFTYSSNNSAIATISGTTVTIVGVGACTITATQAATATFTSGTISATLTVNAILPTVSTSSPSNFAGTSTTCGGNVTSNGGAALSARGVCWSTSINPVVTGSHTSDGTATGIYASSITGLTAYATYYVRAYATNSAGTSYGTQLSFNSGYTYGTITQGGVVFYNDGAGHGIVSSTSDQSTGVVWGGGGVTGASGIAVGTGETNTNAIVTYWPTGTYAANICYNLTLNGFSDWFLPSKDELNLMYVNLKKNGLGSFADASYYWSSTESSSTNAWGQYFFSSTSSQQISIIKNNLNYGVRAVRKF